MSRLDAEYSPADHHDLADIEKVLVGPPPELRYYWVCACGASADWHLKTRIGAVKAHRRHREHVR